MLQYRQKIAKFTQFTQTFARNGTPKEEIDHEIELATKRIKERIQHRALLFFVYVLTV